MSNRLMTPGGDSAVAEGCTCPVLDNRRGKGMGNGQFWINNNCPLHALPKKDEAKEVKE